jgi:delta-aminolevulinic acid dehydratase/porphobilinogen synthase
MYPAIIAAYSPLISAVARWLNDPRLRLLAHAAVAYAEAGADGVVPSALFGGRPVLSDLSSSSVKRGAQR